MIYLYHIASILMLPIYFIVLCVRVLTGKEDIKHIGERFACSRRKRDDGILIWMHAASVGESVIILTLIDNIRTFVPHAHFLVTSGTRSSAAILRTKLPMNAAHQLLPIDNIIFVRKFLRHWRPDLGIFIESELWPCLLYEAAKCCKLLLLSARISDRSLRMWSKVKAFFQSMVGNFSEIIVQSDVDFKKFKVLGIDNVANLGNIKMTNKKLNVDAFDLSLLTRHFQDKRIILFASTHAEDEQVIFGIIKSLKKEFLDCYCILIPRHPERMHDICKMCDLLDLTYNIRSQSNIPDLDKDLYIVDQFGQMGLFFSLAYITFIGGSFNQGGHNILEPAYFSNCVVFGPDMSNNTNLANEMLRSAAAMQINNQDELIKKLQYLMSEQGQQERVMYQANALKFITTKNQQILDNYLAVIKRYIG